MFYQAPLYPYLLGAVFAIVGHSLVAIRLLQAVLGASSCALLAVAGRRFVGARAGLIVGALLAVYPPAIFFDGLIQKSSLDLFLVVLLLALLGELLNRRRWPGLPAAPMRWPPSRRPSRPVARDWRLADRRRLSAFDVRLSARYA